MRTLRPILLAVGTCVFALTSCYPQEYPKYLDPSAPIEQRIDDLLPRLTTEEKIGQIYDNWGSRGIPRLKVPSLLKTEGLHSQSYSTGATIFPQAIAMAATFDTELIREVGGQTAVESKAAHIRASWSPVLDVARDVRWGRLEETYGESPRVLREIHLPPFRAAIEEAKAGGVMAAYGTWDGVPDNASAKLLQGILRQEWGFDGMIVSDCGAPEHFFRKHGIVETSEQAAALAISAGVNMECGSVYKTAAAKALRAGLISEEQLNEAVRPVLRTKFRLGLFEQPEPDQMIWEKLPQYDTPESRTLAHKVSEEGSVLLKNEGHVLPLSKQIKAIAVIGPNANVVQSGDYSPKFATNQMVTVLQGIQSRVAPATRVLYAAGLDNPVSTDPSKFGEAIDAARQADVAIVVVGDQSNPGAKKQTTGENNDGATLDFPGAQGDLIKAVQATGTPVVLVIVNDKPFTLGWEVEHIPVILVTWYPGEEGGDATASLLFGERNPSGRLPFTWPRSPAQLPLHYDYHPSGRRYDYYDLPFAPQFRFGYGQSYTRFEYSNLRIEPTSGDPGFVAITANVRKAGSVDGDEVAQLYLTDLVSLVSTPVIELQGFTRVSLKPGETKTVRFELTPYQLSLLDADMVRRVEPGVFRIHVGGVSPEAPANSTDDRKASVGFRDSFEGISGQFTEPKPYSAQFYYSLDAPEEVPTGKKFTVTLTATNKGNLVDVTEVKLFAGEQEGSWRFELRPGQTKSHSFETAVSHSGELLVVGGPKAVSKSLTVK